MNMYRKPIHVLLAAVALVALTWPLAAHPRQGPGDLGLRARKLARVLELSEEQRERSRALFRATLEDTKPLREQMRQLRGELRQQLTADPVDDAAISRLARELHGLRSQVREKKVALREGFEALLTPRQKERFETLRSLRETLHGPRHAADGPTEGP